MKIYTDFAYNSDRYLLAYHFERMWKIRNSGALEIRDSLRQNIAAQRRHK